MPTGAKVFFILVGALLPLALIALFTTLRTTRTAVDETNAKLSAATSESTGVIENLLANHIAQLDDTLGALERDPGDAASCMRLAGTYAAQRNTRFSVRDARGRLLCGQPLAAIAPAAQAKPAGRPGRITARIVRDGLVIELRGNTGAVASAYYSRDLLASLARPSGFVPDYGAAIVRDNDRLTLRALVSRPTIDRQKTERTQLGIDGLEFEMAMPGVPVTSPLVIATVLLVLMWIAAAAIGWFVVDILLIRPLRRLRRSVAHYRPGEVIDTKGLGPIPAQEIRELGETFSQISRIVHEHEANLAEGLVRQTRLTREVHHRVKNNLQVISSLINFHARGARGVEASEAYASIQRRVDALAVVHRHHYAEMEETRGLEMRSVVGELAANLRATAPEGSRRLGISLEIESLLVNQDVAIAVAFLLTEIVELAIACTPEAQIRISIKAADDPSRATLRVSSPALIGSTAFETLVEQRYGRVLMGLARQLRTQLHHDPLVGAYEATLSVSGRP
jgi:two-component system, sensor histidine kinase PdtaS